MPKCKTSEAVPVVVEKPDEVVDSNSLNPEKPIRLIVRTTREHADQLLKGLRASGWNVVSGLGAEYHRPTERGGDSFSDVLCHGEHPRRADVFGNEITF